MPAKWPWIERRFTFDFPVGKYPDILERFRGTPARLEERVRGLDRAALMCTDGGWTILQNIGHLLDLEPLGMLAWRTFWRGNPSCARRT